jgi:hypothetical protein
VPSETAALDVDAAVAEAVFFVVLDRERVRFAAVGSPEAADAGWSADCGRGADSAAPAAPDPAGAPAAGGFPAADSDGCGGPAGRLADRRRERRTGAAVSAGADDDSGVVADSVRVGPGALDPMVSSLDMHTPRCPRAQRAARRRVGR